MNRVQQVGRAISGSILTEYEVEGNLMNVDRRVEFSSHIGIET